MNWLKKIERIVGRVVWGGHMFNPHYQERTCGLKDIIKNKERRNGKDRRLLKSHMAVVSNDRRQDTRVGLKPRTKETTQSSMAHTSGKNTRVTLGSTEKDS